MSNAIDGGMLVPEPAMAQMFPSGTYVDLLKPRADAIHPGDLAHHLGMLCRYGGGVRRFYSVAEHASLVADLLEYQGQPPVIVLGGLLHDATEAFLADLISPAKFALRYLEAERAGRLEHFDPTNNGEWFAKPPRDLRGVYSELSDRVDLAVAERFGLDSEVFDCPAVKTADMWALKIEAAELTYSRGAGWRWPGELPEGGRLPHEAVAWHGGLAPEDATDAWGARLGRLYGQGAWS
jgi:hypothetical protein